MRLIMKLISVSRSDIKDLFCFGDLYMKLGIDKLSTKNGGLIFTVEQIRANKKTIDFLHDIFVTNVKTSRDKRVKFFKEDYREKLVAWDFVMWAPTTDESIPYMHIGLDEHKERYDKLG